ncbi:MAG: cobalamin-dependent protein [Spirochaetota bacterium]|nr:cobalamin-dependent protein [Spirochaetota bacterium]
MKIVLVFPPFYLEPMYSLPPLGLVNIATTVAETEHQVVIIDFVLSLRNGELSFGKSIYNDCADIILKEKPDLVGFSAQCTTYPPVIQIAKLIKTKSPEILTIIGGHNASFVDHLTLEQYPWIDSIIRGEGEMTFKELTDVYSKLYNLDGVAGVTYRRGDEIIRNTNRDLIQNLDSLSLPDYSFIPPLSVYRDAYELPRSIAILEVGRGCPHKCIYCSESIFWRRSPRHFSVDRLTQEMHNLHENYGAECFLLAYDQFTAQKEFVQAFCQRVIEEGLNHIPWYCISRLDTVNASLLALMRDAGCESMCYGIDSGSQKTLTNICKKIDKDLLYTRVNETTTPGIIPTLSFVVGFPWEKRSDIDDTLILSLKTGALGNINPLIQMPTILPGTELYHKYRDRLVREVDTYFSLGIEFYNGQRLLDDEEIINKNSQIYSSFYNLQCEGCSLSELNLIVTYFPLMITLYPKTLLLLTIEFSQSISIFFTEWLSWITQRLKRDKPILTAQDCYQHFTSFVYEKFYNDRNIHLKHLTNILKYETYSLEVGKYSTSQSYFQIDLNNVQEFIPQRSNDVLIGKFDFDIPMIIKDIKKGLYTKDYPLQEILLVFRQQDDRLTVTEINEFGNMFLSMCDGESTLSSISDKLYIHYSADMNPEEFFESCLEAAQVLGEMGLLVINQFTNDNNQLIDEKIL